MGCFLHAVWTAELLLPVTVKCSRVFSEHFSKSPCDSVKTEKPKEIRYSHGEISF